MPPSTRSKALCLLFLLLMFSLASAQEQEFLFSPSTVEELDATVTLKTDVSIVGEISEGDSLSLRMFTFQGLEGQELLESNETLAIAGSVLTPDYEYDKGNRFAVFEIPDLSAYPDIDSFTVEITVRIKKTATPFLSLDYDLSTPISTHTEFLAPSLFIESNDPELVSKAELEFSQDSGFETIRAIAEWVHNNITYDFNNYYYSTFSAKQTYESRKGVCDEFANLSAAFLRSRGIPARYNIGVTFDGLTWGNHGWLEVFLPGEGWLGFDSTFGEAGFVDATHLVLARLVDANQAVERVLLPSHLDVEFERHLPDVEINSIKHFSGLLDISLSSVREARLGEGFEVEAELENLSDQTTILPLRLSMHPDFVFDGSTRLVLFAPSETKTLSWSVEAPSEGTPGVKTIYTYSLSSVDQEVEARVSVLPEETSKPLKSGLAVEDVSPFISASSLRLDVRVFNSGGLPARMEVVLGHSGLDHAFTEVVGPGERQTFSYVLDSPAGDRVLLSIFSDENLFLEIPIPEAPAVEEKLLETRPASEPGLDDLKVAPTPGDTAFGFAGHEVFLPVVAGILFMLLLAVWFKLR